MRNDLIYDVGVCDGSDTAYYLHLGYRVIGIEASPVMAATVRAKFAQSVKDGSLVILDVGVAESNGEMEFWICDDYPEWSSFDRALAGRDGARHHPVQVKVCCFSDILEKFGVPFYCKIDIEGKDRECVKSLRSCYKIPMYISIEMSHNDAGEDIDILKSIGYNRFKIVSQTYRAQPIPLATSFRYALPERYSRLVRRIEKKLRGVSSDRGWAFMKGSSGPFGEAAPGRWRSYTEVIALWRRLRDLDAQYARGGLGDWYDIHAAQ